MKKIKRLGVSLKNWWKNRSLKQHWGLSFLGLLAVFIIYVAVALLSVSRAEISLARLKNSLETEKICHENCQLNRAQEQTEIVKALQTSEGRLKKRLLKYFFDSQESREFKKELIKIWRQGSQTNDLPSELEEYLQSPVGDPELQALIIKSWLAENTARPRIDYYFSLLSGDADLILKEEAVYALSNIKDKKSYLTAAQLENISHLVLSATTANKLRQSLILLLADYYSLFPAETENILLAVYKNSNLPDKISRAFSADLLNRRRGLIKFTLPEISASEWAEYYNN
jgi:hypothetical protein